MMVSMPLEYTKQEADVVFDLWDGYFDIYTKSPDIHSFTYFVQPNAALWMQRLNYTTCSMQDLMSCYMWDDHLLDLKFGRWLNDNNIII